eukprot:snap_masked-scaffold_3-processed-gene-4.4-mRNA-1 protein AED:1.00 eAED:1.00 QI:0/-1/0/0/-1/1/1/0/107
MKIKYPRLLTVGKLLYEEVKNRSDGWSKFYATALKMIAALKKNSAGSIMDVHEVSVENSTIFASPRKIIRRGKMMAEWFISRMYFPNGLYQPIIKVPSHFYLLFIGL